MGRLIVYSAALIVIFTDQATKLWILRSVGLDVSIPVVNNFFYITRTTNTGSAFGLFPSATGVLAGAALIAALAIIYYCSRSDHDIHALQGLALGLPLGGALGNFLDRVRLHYVVDFFDMRFGSYHFPVFNVADSAICVGVVLLILTQFRGARGVAHVGPEPSGEAQR